MEQILITRQNSSRQAATNTLAVIGFIALVFLGIMLAIYAARYVPTAISRIASSAVFLSGDSDAQLTVVSTTTLPFPAVMATSTAPTTTPSVAATSTPVMHSPEPIVGYHTATTSYPVPGSIQVPVSPNLYGLPNLVATITGVGYMDNNGNFVADDTITSHQELAVKILVTNTGTNTTGSWDIETSVPTKADATFDHTETESSLSPNQSLFLTLKLTTDDPRVGNDEAISVTADPDNKIAESDEDDNTATASITVTN